MVPPPRRCGKGSATGSGSAPAARCRRRGGRRSAPPATGRRARRDPTYRCSRRPPAGGASPSSRSADRLSTSPSVNSTSVAPTGITPGPLQRRRRRRGRTQHPAGPHRQQLGVPVARAAAAAGDPADAIRSRPVAGSSEANSAVAIRCSPSSDHGACSRSISALGAGRSTSSARYTDVSWPIVAAAVMSWPTTSPTASATCPSGQDDDVVEVPADVHALRRGQVAHRRRQARDLRRRAGAAGSPAACARCARPARTAAPWRRRATPAVRAARRSRRRPRLNGGRRRSAPRVSTPSRRPSAISGTATRPVSSSRRATARCSSPAVTARRKSSSTERTHCVRPSAMARTPGCGTSPPGRCRERSFVGQLAPGRVAVPHRRAAWSPAPRPGR